MNIALYNRVLLASCCLWGSSVQAQCSSTEDKVVITILTDNYANEISWDLVDANGNTLASDSYGFSDDNTLFDYTVCIGARRIGRPWVSRSAHSGRT